MLQLAEQFAKLKGTEIIGHRIENNSIVFVLASGGKFIMSTRQLEEAIAALTPSQDQPEQVEEVEIQLKPKAKKKGSKAE